MTEREEHRGQEVHGPQTNIDGDVNGPVLSGVFNAPVILKNFFSEKVFKRLGLEQRIGFVFLAVLTIGVGLGLYLALKPSHPTQMAGDFRIAVAGFAEVENGNLQKTDLGMKMGQDIYERLKQHFEPMDLDFVITVWGPDQVDRINGKDQGERATAAEQIAKDIGADIVVYGIVDTTRAMWQVTPEFYVAAKNFYEADEMIGQYGLGDPFSVVGNGGTATRIALNDQLSHRVEVLARITVGLARYSFHHFDRALETFKSVERVEGLTDEPGVQRVLYLLIGNAAGKNDELDLAEQYYTRSQVIDPEYARPYAGLGSVRYIQALDAFSEGITVTARTKSEEAIKYYHEALDAPFKPPLADIESKAHFGLGRTYLLRSIMHQSDMSEAAQELQWVIDDYERSLAERLRERAAAAHTSLGLIYRLSAEDELAIAEYKKAIELIENIPQLQDKLAKYYAALGDEYLEAGELVDAIDAYQHAIQLTNLPEVVENYEDRLEQVQSQLEGP